jgi:tetratricopeptide (TPR) repeat protein
MNVGKAVSGWMAVLVALAGLGMASAWTIRAAWADYWMRQETAPATLRAISAMPGQAEAYARLAWLTSLDDPHAAGIALERAVALDPWDAQSWIELGLQAEAVGDNGTAERLLLRAAQADNKFLPRWTLANYYYRRNETEKFWLWCKRAAEMAYGDPLPLFQLCAREEQDGKLMERLEIRNPDVQAAYLYYLMSLNRMDLAGPAVRRAMRNGREADTPLLLAACERFLESRHVAEAAEVWNGLAAAKRVAFPTPNGSGAQLAVNGSFSEAPSSRGFDWRLPAVDGVSISREEAPGGLRVAFNGRQPEECEVLAQFVPLPGKTEYELSFDVRTQGVAAGSGLVWRITDADGGKTVSDSASIASEKGERVHWRFQVPAACRLVRLALRYRRSPGTTRVEGYAIVRDVVLKPV